MVRFSFLPKTCLIGILACSFCLVGATVSAKEKKEDKTFAIRVKAAPVPEGDTGAVHIEIEAKGEYKWNDKFPAAVNIETKSKKTHVRFDKSAFSSKDFKVEGKTAGVKIPFKAVLKGRQSVTAKVRFSVCNAESCIIKTEAVQLKVSVK